MDPIEHRLRKRIDTITDQRNQALDTVDVLKAKLRKAQKAAVTSRQRAELWKHRATELAWAAAQYRRKRDAA